MPNRFFDLVGHRGARGLYPENTVPGFLGALETGVTALELDVHVSRDGYVVVCHDPWVMSDGKSRAVYDLSASELGMIDVGRTPDPRFPDRPAVSAGIPVLGDVFAAVGVVGRSVGWYVEVKSTPAGAGLLHPPPDAFARAVMEAIGQQPRVTVISFDPRILQEVRRLRPDLRLHLLVEKGSPLRMVEHVDRLGFIPTGLGPERSLVDPELVDWAHGCGMRVVPWTVNDPQEMARMIAAGVDGITTDRPDLAVPLIRRPSRS